MKYMIGDELGNMWHEENRFNISKGSALFHTKELAKKCILKLAKEYNSDYEWALKIYGVEMLDEDEQLIGGEYY